MTRVTTAVVLCLFAAVISLSAADPPPRRTPTPADGSEPQEPDPNDPRFEQERERANARIGSRLTRGPYLQLATPNSMVVRWRTDVPSANVVRFGLNRTNLRWTARSPGALTEHVVLLTNLLPATRYFYALSTNTFTGTGSNIVFTASTNSFLTPPPTGPPKPTRVWVLGDPGTRKPVQYAVRDAFHKFNGGRQIDLWLLLGDNAYDAGRDNEYQAGIFLPYVETLRTIPLWPSLGNHDGGSAHSPTQSGVYYDIFTLPTLGQAGGVMSGTEAYYSFDHAHIHFIALDSHDSDRRTNGAMARWLRADLTANQRPWTVAYFHHPPYSKGSHDTDDDRDGDGRSRHIRENICPILEAGGVDLVLCGHSHAYERSWFMGGHYKRSTNFSYSMVKNRGDGRIDGDGPYRKPSPGPASHEGTVYLVAGSSGQKSGVKAAHPAMMLALNMAGSTVLDFDGLRLDVTFVDELGLERDHFTILKGDGGPAPTARERIVRSTRRGSDSVPRRLRPLLETADLAIITNALPADQFALLDAYTNATDAAVQSRLTWALAAVGDAAVAKKFTTFVTNKIRDRVISADEEDVRFATVQALGLLATRYEPALDFLRKGISADWWYFRTNWVSTRPYEQTAANLQTCTLQALGMSGRPEAGIILSNAFRRYKQFTVDDPERLVREYTAEITTASNRLAEFPKYNCLTWPRRILLELAPHRSVAATPPTQQGVSDASTPVSATPSSSSR